MSPPSEFDFSRPPAAGRFWFSVETKRLGSFTEVSGLGVRMKTDVLREGGHGAVSHQLPGELEWNNLKLKRGLSRSDDLLNWLKTTADECKSGQKATTYTASLAMLGLQGELVGEWIIQDALPVAWTGPSFDASSQSIAIEELEIAHSGILSRDRI